MLEAFFHQLLKYRAVVLTLGLIGIGLCGSFLPSLQRDTSADAFIRADNPALLYRDEIKRMFGLADPIIVAVFQDGEAGVFTPEGLQLVDTLTQQIKDVANIDPEQVASLATENNITGTKEGMEVDPFFDVYPDSPQAAQAIWQQVQDFPLYIGTLVAEDGSGTLIVAEVMDERGAQDTYIAIERLVNDALNNPDLPKGIELHLAGEAAVTGYLGRYIDSDAQRLNPMAGIVITIILFLAFRTIAGGLVPNLIVLATVTGAVGLMAAAKVPMFVITNGMPVVLIGIAVADSIHILSSYYEKIADEPEISNVDAVVHAMVEMSRPITLTSLTTIAGFLGLYIASVQPPMQFLGLFTALDIAIAWLYSMTVLPAVMSFLKIRVVKKTDADTPTDRVATRSGFSRRLMYRVGLFVTGSPRLVVGGGLMLILAGLIGASNIRVDDRRMETFHPNEPIVAADKIINEKFNGTGVFDIVIETDEPEALFEPSKLRKIEALQREVERYAIVGGTTSVVDYLKQMNRSLNEGDKAAYQLVDNEALNAQLFLLYSTAGDPTDFEEEIDYDYQRANIRVNLKNTGYVEVKPVIRGLNRYIEETFNEPGMRATISGRAMLSYVWVDNVGSSHFKSVAVSLVLVMLMASLVFRSVTAGLLSLAPVLVSILFVYAVMATLRIDIGIGTSMFASVAIGLGVDFAIHTIDRIKTLFKEPNVFDAQDSQNIAETMLALYPSTGRALFFNLLAIALGFGVLVTSEVVPLARFGAIVALSVSSAFIFSLTFLPALILLLRPAFVFGREQKKLPLAAAPIIVLAGLGTLLMPPEVSADVAEGVSRTDDLSAIENLSGLEVMARVVARDDGEFVSRNLTMQLTDKRGKTRIRETRGFRKYFGDEKRTVLFYLSPTNVKDTGFLTWDYKDNAVDDDQWLYLPAMRKIRRISASDRGDYFLGTDLSYEDIKNENKPNLQDYSQTRLGKEIVDGVHCIVVEGIPVSNKIAEELGYSRVLSRIDPHVWMSRKTEYWDVKGNPLKQVSVKQIEKIDGIWTAHRIDVENHKTGHRTEFVFSEFDYTTPVDDGWFETRKLARGL